MLPKVTNLSIAILFFGMTVTGIVGLTPGCTTEPVHDESGGESTGPPARNVPDVSIDTGPVLTRARNLSSMKSLLVNRNGERILTYYDEGHDPSRAVNIKSASKSVLSALIGIALDEGHLRDLDQRLVEFFPNLLEDAPPSKKNITLRNVLLMRSGLESTSFGNYGAWVTSNNWVRDALRRPLVDPPGEVTNYSTGNSHILSAVLTKATDRDLKSYAQDRLFDPLEVRIRSWQRSPEGYRFGGNNFSLTPVGFLRFGQLFLKEGRWKGQQVVPSDWVEESTRAYVHDTYHGYPYGYFWWNATYRGWDVDFAWGHGGQYVFIVPRLNLVVATTSNLQSTTDDDDYTETVHELLEDDILPDAGE